MLSARCGQESQREIIKKKVSHNRESFNRALRCPFLCFIHLENTMESLALLSRNGLCKGIHQRHTQDF